MIVRAKFKCSSITRYEFGKKIHFDVVQSGSEENKAFSKYTPSGSLDLTVDIDVPAASTFKVGKEYYLDITECEAAETAES